MATYKAEFMSHYWAGRLRPRQAYVLGLIAVVAANLGERMPRLANLATQLPGLRTMAKAFRRRRARAAHPAPGQPDIQRLVRRTSQKRAFGGRT